MTRPLTRREFVRRAAAVLALNGGTARARSALIAGGLEPGLAPFTAPAGSEQALLGSTADEVRARVDGATLALENGAIAARWQLGFAGSTARAGGSGLSLVHLEDRRDRRAGGRLTVSGPQRVFSITLGDGRTMEAGELRLAGPPRIETLQPDPHASRASERIPGRRIVATLADPDGRFEAIWAAVLRNGSHYVRQGVSLRALGADLHFREMTMIALELAEPPRIVGNVKGSPAVAGRWFFGFEHPLSEGAVDDAHLRCWLPRILPLRAGQAADYSSVTGVTPEGQLRRGFLRYVERERAHPYRTFLHYNSWYDIGYGTSFDEAAALDAIHAVGRELHDRRGVTLDSFLFDDGWDDYKLWGFNEGFARGFAPLTQAAARYGAAPGVWLSPWGGYGKAREARLAYGRTQGFETNDKGFALSGPVYYRRFHEVCLEMIGKYGVNQFKFDGTGDIATVVPDSEFGSDFEAALALIADLRRVEPDLFVNLTTGTYPSPFWLHSVDSTWRGGNDHAFAGAGSDRQQWITYRDSQTFANIVRRGPLYPLNALMLHGVIYARHAKRLDGDPHGDFDAEVRSYFGSGTALQELYVTHALLSADDWRTLAEAAKWSRSRAGTLVDTHWMGGDPAKLEVYGWASWSPRRGILTLRNPSDRVQSLEVDAAVAFELPDDAARQWSARSARTSRASGQGRAGENQAKGSIEMQAGRVHTFRLNPFEVMTLEALPR